MPHPEKIIPCLKSFFLLLFEQVQRDRCFQVAGSLTYSSVLALVPLVVIAFSLVSHIPGFADVLASVQATIIGFLAPVAEQQLLEFLGTASTQTRGLTVFSFLALVVVAILMIGTVDKTINHIWAARPVHRGWIRLLVYIGILVGGPILVAASVLVSTYLASMPYLSPVLQLPVLKSTIFILLPVVLLCLFTTFLYYWVPNVKIRLWQALIGGIVATVLFEIAKMLFTFYVLYVSSYETLYGLLAAIPLTLIWINLCWAIVLIGAEVTYCVGNLPDSCSDKESKEK